MERVTEERKAEVLEEMEMEAEEDVMGWMMAEGQAEIGGKDVVVKEAEVGDSKPAAPIEHEAFRAARRVRAAPISLPPPLTLVYTSSYDRGLEHMLKYGWPLIHSAFPSATLHLYYGWRTHELLHPKSEWRESMKDMISSFGDSIVDHGRVGQEELLRTKARAQILYYVGDWPEIDCIAVREAAMLGCVPLTSSVAVFGDEEKDYVVKVEGDPTEAATQVEGAKVAMRLLAEYVKSGRISSVEVRTERLMEETWRRVAERWLEVID